ncbi:MAG: hypothetical protein A3H35_06925 [Betaproteobacteria bacterium RIFCSPLOWO2_02_FULL_62_17]|nr:MAG: hypothetical protein A3H35_06925 [Betaproteobacteria bacterium RIFCSPLOWO2_02_FULL_62_17]
MALKKDDIPPPWRVPLLLLAFAALFLGIDAGLARLGWDSPGAGLAAVHGPLMASGFFGTVISLERAVALGRRWAYAAPLAAGLGALAAMLAAPPQVAPLLTSAGSLVMLAASLLVSLRQRELFTLTMALGAACWSVASLLWLAGRPVFALAPWWIAFLVLTIAGERLELSRFLPASPVAKRVFALLLAGNLLGVAVSLFDAAIGTQILGFALAGLALWLMRQDVARRTVRGQGLTRFIAVCLLSGYVWLAVGGVSMLLPGGLGYGGAAYDAALHAVMLGFVFSMVFGHAPIIFPAVLRVAVPYHSYFYAPLALLHASLLIRLVGDWMLLPEWRAWGGMLNGVALVAFVAGTIAAVIGGRLAAAKQSVR